MVKVGLYILSEELMSLGAQGNDILHISYTIISIEGILLIMKASAATSSLSLVTK